MFNSYFDITRPGTNCCDREEIQIPGSQHSQPGCLEVFGTAFSWTSSLTLPIAQRRRCQITGATTRAAPTGEPQSVRHFLIWIYWRIIWVWIKIGYNHWIRVIHGHTINISPFSMPLKRISVLPGLYFSGAIAIAISFLPGCEAHRPQSAVQLEDLAADLGHFPGERSSRIGWISGWIMMNPEGRWSNPNGIQWQDLMLPRRFFIVFFHNSGSIFWGRMTFRMTHHISKYRFKYENVGMSGISGLSTDDDLKNRHTIITHAGLSHSNIAVLMMLMGQSGGFIWARMLETWG